MPSDEERRRAKRHVLWIPFQVQQGDEVRMLAVSRDISWTGALVMTGGKIEIGAVVDLLFMLPGKAQEKQLRGEIVRVEDNTADPEGVWRYRLAIRFQEPVEELEEEFERLEAAKLV